MKTGLAFGTIAFGFLLLLLSGLWGILFPVTSTWTQAKATRSAEVKGKIHNMSFVLNGPTPQLHSGQDLGQMKAEYEQLKKENEQLNADFNSAADTPRTIATVLKWTGISLACVGLIGWYAANQSR